MFQPRGWSLAAKASRDQPFLVRHFRTCGPFKFIIRIVTDGDGSVRREKQSVHMHTNELAAFQDSTKKAHSPSVPWVA